MSCFPFLHTYIFSVSCFSSSINLVLSCSAAFSDDKYEIGVLQPVQHAVHDAATQGFMDALTEKLGVDQGEFDVQNASGDTAACTQLVNTFVSNEVDLIIANANPALQAVMNATLTSRCCAPLSPTMQLPRA